MKTAYKFNENKEETNVNFFKELHNLNAITQEHVNNFIKDIESITFGEKTTVVKVTLITGFEIVETSSCVDPKNYNEELGRTLCLKRIQNKVWELLGFLLQAAKYNNNLLK